MHVWHCRYFCVDISTLDGQRLRRRLIMTLICKHHLKIIFCITGRATQNKTNKKQMRPGHVRWACLWPPEWEPWVQGGAWHSSALRQTRIFGNIAKYFCLCKRRRMPGAAQAPGPSFWSSDTCSPEVFWAVFLLVFLFFFAWPAMANAIFKWRWK